MDNSVPSKDLHGNSLINTSKLVGKVTSTYHCNPSNNGYDHYNTYYIYDFYGHSDLVFHLFFNKSSGLDEAILYSGYNKDGEFVHDRDVAYYAYLTKVFLINLTMVRILLILILLIINLLLITLMSINFMFLIF